MSISSHLLLYLFNGPVFPQSIRVQPNVMYLMMKTQLSVYISQTDITPQQTL